MLLMIGHIYNWFTGQPDDITSLRNIILEVSWRLDIFVAHSERRIGKLHLEDTHVSVSKTSFVGFFEHTVSPVVSFRVQGRIHLFLCFEPQFVQRGMTDNGISP